jgi:hypothetical protein
MNRSLLFTHHVSPILESPNHEFTLPTADSTIQELKDSTIRG